MTTTTPQLTADTLWRAAAALEDKAARLIARSQDRLDVKTYEVARFIDEATNCERAAAELRAEFDRLERINRAAVTQ